MNLAEIVEELEKKREDKNKSHDKNAVKKSMNNWSTYNKNPEISDEIDTTPINRKPVKESNRYGKEKKDRVS